MNNERFNKTEKAISPEAGKSLQTKFEVNIEKLTDT
jgi:hypothetical protein